MTPEEIHEAFAAAFPSTTREEKRFLHETPWGPCYLKIHGGCVSYGFIRPDKPPHSDTEIGYTLDLDLEQRELDFCIKRFQMMIDEPLYVILHSRRYEHVEAVLRSRGKQFFCDMLPQIIVVHIKLGDYESEYIREAHRARYAAIASELEVEEFRWNCIWHSIEAAWRFSQ